MAYVAIVVDPAYGERLKELSANVPVWVVATPVNEDACRRIWQGRSIADHRSPGSITAFKIHSEAENRRTHLLDVIPIIEEHYGSWKVAPSVPNDPENEYLHLPDGFGVDVVGLGLTDDLKDSLRRFGFFSFAPTSVGFRAWIVRESAAT